MDDQRISAFGGIMGRVLRDSMSFGTTVTGVILAVILLASSLITGMVEARAVGFLFGQIIIALALARFALNGMAGEWRGTILSDAGGTWPMAFAVAGRYLALNLAWAAPLLLIGWSLVGSALTPAPAIGGSAPTDPLAPPTAGGAGNPALVLPILGLLTSKAFIAVVGLLVFGTALLPPLFLIVAVRSAGFSDIFSPALWRATFAGRLADLYCLYAIHGGALGMLMILAIPGLLLTFAAGVGIGMLALVVGLAFGGGLAITLMGRLCGFFAFGEDQPGPVFGRAPAGGRVRPSEIFGEATGAAGPVAALPVAVDSPPAGPPPAGQHFAGPVTVPDVEEGPDPSGLPVLADAAERAAAARKKFETDQEAALLDLAELSGAHAPSPHLAHALALCLRQADRPEALEAARLALPLCLSRGQVTLAAEIFAAFWKQAKDLGLGHETIDQIAAALVKSGDHGRAISAYGMALQMDHGDRRAIKGLLQLADQKLHRDGRPKDAARIYTFLLQYAATTPFGDDMRRGLADAEARLSRAS